MRKLIVMTIIFFITSSTICHRFECPKYYCDISLLNGNNCSVKEIVNDEKDDIITQYVKYTLKPCSGKNEICPYTKMNNIKEVSCITPNYFTSNDLRSYPGQRCNSKKLIEYNQFLSPIDADRIYNYCNRDSDCDIYNSTCSSVMPFSTCNTHHECPLNYACIEEKSTITGKRCIPQKTVGESCTQDFHCQNNLGCDLLNFICIEYFSLDSGTVIKDASKNVFPLCKSGEVINGICSEEYFSINSDCTSTGICIYENKDKTIKISDQNKCKCGYNSDGKNIVQNLTVILMLKITTIY